MQSSKQSCHIWLWNSTRVSFYSSRYKTVPPPEIHLTAEVCGCIVRGLSIHFHWQNNRARKNTANLVEEQRMSFSIAWMDNSTVGNHISPTLTLLPITHITLGLRHSIQHSKSKSEKRLALWMCRVTVGDEHTLLRCGGLFKGWTVKAIYVLCLRKSWSAVQLHRPRPWHNTDL